MYKVFLFNKALVFLSPQELEEADPSATAYRFRDHADLLQRYRGLVQNRDEESTLYVLDEDPRRVWELFAGGFRNVLAAGGTVFDPQGRMLFIFRHNRWDLPKGKVEEGEDPSRAAEREVEEECSIEVTRNEGHLVDSYHIYQDRGVEHLKRTSWYRMYAESPGDPVPQTEEGILKVEWKAFEEWDEVRKNTFASIREVIDIASSRQPQ